LVFVGVFGSRRVKFYFNNSPQQVLWTIKRFEQPPLQGRDGDAPVFVHLSIELFAAALLTQKTHANMQNFDGFQSELPADKAGNLDTIALLQGRREFYLFS
jgi:hypothetical protein